MAQDPQVNERLLQRRRMMGIPENAGRMSRARFNDDGTQLIESSDPRIRSRFGHILGGALKDRIEEFDQQESIVFRPPPRVNPNSEFGEGGRTPAAITTRDSSMPPMGRRNQRRGPQQQVQKVTDQKFTVPLAEFHTNSPSELADLSQINAMFGGDYQSGGGHRGPRGPLMPERGHDTTLGDGYINSAPFNLASQIMNRVAARSQRGVDYREIESREQPALHEYEEYDDRYVSSTTRRSSAHDQQLMQEMARSMAQEMIKAVMQENKGKKYYKEVKTTHQFDSPTAKLVEIDGKYYRMDLKPVKLTKK